MGQLVVGDVVPEVVVNNSHDGACAFRQIRRTVSASLLQRPKWVRMSEIESISVRHTGNVLQAAKTFGTVRKWGASCN